MSEPLPSSSSDVDPQKVRMVASSDSVSQFDWSIARTGDVEVSFADTSSGDNIFQKPLTNEITLNYNISNHPFVVAIYNVSCTGTPVSSSIVAVTTTLTATTYDHSNLLVALHVNKSEVVGSHIWSEGTGIGVAHLDLCIRVDLVLDTNDVKASSINFDEQKIYITLNLIEGFTAIIDNPGGTYASSTNAAASQNLNACLCSQQGSCFFDPLPALVQGSDVFICIFSTSSGIGVFAISELTFSQNGLSVASIHNFLPDAVTAVSQFEITAENGITPAIQGIMVHSKMRAEFFNSSVPAPVNVAGSAVISFQRRLHVVPLARMIQQQGASTASFKFALHLRTSHAMPGDEGNSKKFIIAASAASLVAVLVLAVTFFHSHRYLARGARRLKEMEKKDNASQRSETDDGESYDVI